MLDSLPEPARLFGSESADHAAAEMAEAAAALAAEPDFPDERRNGRDGWVSPENLHDPALPEALPLADKAVSSRKAMNTTAYRIFKLLEWLIQTPLSVEMLNRRFCREPLIGKAVSTDTIWLYVNTLKQLGCTIRRPSPRNGYRYELLSHPFGFTITADQLETLAKAKAHAQGAFSHQEMSVLDRLLKKIVNHSNAPEPDTVLQTLFSRSRSFDTDACKLHTEILQSAADGQQLLTLTYLSPMHGESVFSFLPEMLYYEQGALYVRGERVGRELPSNLRVDRVLALESLTDEALRQAALQSREAKTTVVLHFPVLPSDFAPSPGKAGAVSSFAALQPLPWQGLGLEPRHGVYAETAVFRPDAAQPSWEVTLAIRDSFYLRQKLLSLGRRFRVETPAALAETMTETLSAMLEFYTSDETPPDSGDSQPVENPLNPEKGVR